MGGGLGISPMHFIFFCCDGTTMVHRKSSMAKRWPKAKSLPKPSNQMNLHLFLGLARIFMPFGLEKSLLPFVQLFFDMVLIPFPNGI